MPPKRATDLRVDLRLLFHRGQVITSNSNNTISPPVKTFSNTLLLFLRVIKTIQIHPRPLGRPFLIHPKSTNRFSCHLRHNLNILNRHPFLSTHQVAYNHASRNTVLSPAHL